MQVEYFYSITIIRKMGSLEDGHMWKDMLPDELFLSRYNFDGWEVHVDNSKGEAKVQTYEVFWYPETYEHARELFDVIHEIKDHILFEGCDFRFAVTPRYPKTVDVGVM